MSAWGEVRGRDRLAGGDEKVSCCAARSEPASVNDFFHDQRATAFEIKGCHELSSEGEEGRRREEGEEKEKEDKESIGQKRREKQEDE